MTPEEFEQWNELQQGLIVAIERRKQMFEEKRVLVRALFEIYKEAGEDAESTSIYLMSDEDLARRVVKTVRNLRDDFEKLVDDGEAEQLSR